MSRLVLRVAIPATSFAGSQADHGLAVVLIDLVAGLASSAGGAPLPRVVRRNLAGRPAKPGWSPRASHLFVQRDRENSVDRTAEMKPPPVFAPSQ
jgi:hypothetical protein